MCCSGWKERTMRSILVCFVVPVWIILYSAQSVQAQNLLRNPGFENFTNGEPDSWTTSNIPGLLVLVSPSKETHSGKSGVKLEVKSFYGTKMAGTASQENIPAAARQFSLTGFYRLKSVGGDKAFVHISLISDKKSTICVGNLTLEPSAGFKEFSLPLSVQEGNTAVKAKVCIAIIAGDNDQTHEGTTAIFDDIVLKPSQPNKEVIGAN
jgi:hypothetical protein